MEIQFLGSGDAFGSGGRFQTCIAIRSHAQNYLIDCGASSLVAMRRFQFDPNSVAAILITHLHGDHFGGLAFFLLDTQLISRRTAPLTIAGPPGLRTRLEELRRCLFPGSERTELRFALDVQELTPGAKAEVSGLTVEPHEMRHPCGAPPFALRVCVDGKTICYSGDTEWTDSLIAAAHDADLFVAEAYTFEKPIKYHLDYATLAKHLPEIGAKRLILTHMSQDMLAKAASTGFACASDGLVVAM